MMMRIPPKFAKHLVNLPGILRGNAEFDVTIYGKDGCEKNVVAATEKKTEPYSCVGKQNEVDQPVRKDQKHGTNIETIDIESDSKIESDISMTKLNDQQQPQGQKNLPKRFLMQHIKVKQQKITRISKKNLVSEIGHLRIPSKASRRADGICEKQFSENW
ncbi:hypothetical protein OIU74_004386 [Salix koriyanagi]|uniref:Uncharacterized protein n=1 Tax=Salix koriyanagi TaxID=2511006 RepID=A0A9Q0ZM67_9ROSI|nr:hypothetical protein OIU74_004386 [Salix koriyanagi]